MNFKKFIIQNSQHLAFTGCAISLFATIFDRKYIDKFLLYRRIRIENDKILFCDKYLHGLMMEVGTEMNIPKDKLQKIVLFHNYINNPNFFGSLKEKKNFQTTKNELRSLPCIGLPLHFKNVNFEDTNYDKLQIERKVIDIAPDSPTGVHFRQQHVYTEDCKKFIMARQLFFLQSNSDIVRTIVQILLCYGLFQIIYHINKFSKLFSTGNAFLSNLVVMGLCVSTYYLGREILAAYYINLELKGDKIASKLSTRYHAGALEYYTKLINANKHFYSMGFTNRVNKLGTETTGFFKDYNMINSHIRIYKLLHPDSE